MCADDVDNDGHTVDKSVYTFLCVALRVDTYMCGNSFAIWLPHIFTFLACGANTLRL